jgi:DNA-binding Xre family transcriptional regulator
MSRRRGFKASREGVRNLRKKMSQKCYNQEELAEEADVGIDQVKRLLNPQWRKCKVQGDAIEKIARALDLQPTDIVSPNEWYPNPEDNSSPQTPTDSPSDETHSFAEPELPDGPVPLDSRFYVERPAIEILCYQEILRSGALLRIKAPSKMGKTSVLDRTVDSADKQGYKTVRLNLLQASGAEFSNLDKFLRWFCVCVSHKLHLPAPLNDYWDEDRGSIVNCTTYFQEHLLEQIDTPLVLALDEVDRVFQFPEITTDFFPMLRSWHEEAKNVDIWKQLRLVVVHSTENYGSLDINQSPFNVGLAVELKEFTSEQVADLARRHQLHWNDTQVQHLMAMVGGHPYLVRLALYHLAQPSMLSSNTQGLGECLEQLLQNAPRDTGIYDAYLRGHLKTLKENPKLAVAFKQIVSTSEPGRLETMEAYKLYSMGLIKRLGEYVTPRYELYRLYFREKLREIKS